MKNIKWAGIFLLFLVGSLSAGAHFGNPPSNAATQVFSLDELKSHYGQGIQAGEGVDLATLQNVEILRMENPCAQSEFGLCGPVEAQARIYARNIANDCCCTITFGYECCNPATGGDIAVLFLQQPTKPCN